MKEFILKSFFYFVLAGGLTIVCFKKDSKLLFKNISQLNLSERHSRIAEVLRGAIIVFIIYTLLTFAVKQGLYFAAGEGKPPTFGTLANNYKYLSILKDYNDLVNAVLTTFVSIFTYIAYLMPRAYSTQR
jgi:uncharacterized membrane protein (GlpM family)